MTIVWVVLLVLVALAFEGWFWPVRPCRKCGGRGQFRSPVTRSWRPCSCDGGVVLKWRAKLLGRRADG